MPHEGCNKQLIYERSRRDIIQKIGSGKGVVSIYEYGTVKAPGASDIDTMVFLADEIDSSITQTVSKDVLEGETRDVLDAASIILVPRRRAEELLIWDDLAFNKLCGEDIPFQPWRAYEKELEVARIVDWLPERIFRAADIASGNYGEKKSVALLYSFCRSLHKVEKLVGFNVSGSGDVWGKVAEFRKMLEEDISPDPKMLVEVARYAVEVGCQALNDFGQWCAYDGLYGEGRLSAGQSSSIPGGGAVEFSDVKRAHFDWQTMTMTLPGLIYSHFSYYAAPGGVVSGWIKKKMKISAPPGRLTIAETHRQVLARRINLANYWGEWFLKRELRAGMFKFGWALQS